MTPKLEVIPCEKSYACEEVTCQFHEDNPNRIKEVGYVQNADRTNDTKDGTVQRVWEEYKVTYNWE